MSGHDKIIIKGLTQNNLKNISLEIPKEKIVVFTGVSGSGKSSIVFDTIAAESSRQMNETYPAFIRGRLPKYTKPKADLIDNLTASVIIDQSRLGGNARSTVGTISDMYSALRLLYSRIGEPYTGTASYFSFNDPNGMCPKCSGIGKILELDYDQVIRADLSLNEGMVDLPAFHPGSWYWKQYTQSGLFDLDKKWRDYSDKERSILLYGAYERGGKQIDKKVEGIYNHLNRLLIKRDLSASGDRSILRLNKLLKEQECPHCRGKRLNAAALSCRINGYNIAEMCEMEFTRLSAVLRKITDPRSETIVNNLIASLTRLIDIGLPYLSMNRESTTPVSYTHLAHTVKGRYAVPALLCPDIAESNSYKSRFTGMGDKTSIHNCIFICLLQFFHYFHSAFPVFRIYIIPFAVKLVFKLFLRITYHIQKFGPVPPVSYTHLDVYKRQVYNTVFSSQYHPAKASAQKVPGCQQPLKSGNFHFLPQKTCKTV